MLTQIGNTNKVFFGLYIKDTKQFGRRGGGLTDGLIIKIISTSDYDHSQFDDNTIPLVSKKIKTRVEVEFYISKADYLAGEDKTDIKVNGSFLPTSVEIEIPLSDFNSKTRDDCLEAALIEKIIQFFPSIKESDFITIN